MEKKVRYRTLFILAVVLACVFGIVGAPRNYQQLKENLADRIKLGLDLKGGSHLILQVHVDDAVKVVRDQALERLKDAKHPLYGIPSPGKRSHPRPPQRNSRHEER
jgi:preprotein translocase subunit SecD